MFLPHSTITHPHQTAAGVCMRANRMGPTRQQTLHGSNPRLTRGVGHNQGHLRHGLNLVAAGHDQRGQGAGGDGRHHRVAAGGGGWRAGRHGEVGHHAHAHAAGGVGSLQLAAHTAHERAAFAQHARHAVHASRAAATLLVGCPGLQPPAGKALCVRTHRFWFTLILRCQRRQTLVGAYM